LSAKVGCGEVELEDEGREEVLNEELGSGEVEMKFELMVIEEVGL
jgi:hypothetical protein